MLDIKPIYRHRLKQSEGNGEESDLKIYSCVYCGKVITDTENAEIEELETSLMFEPCQES